MIDPLNMKQKTASSTILAEVTEATFPQLFYVVGMWFEMLEFDKIMVLKIYVLEKFIWAIK